MCDKAECKWKQYKEEEIEVITSINVVDGVMTITKEKIKVLVSNETLGG